MLIFGLSQSRARIAGPSRPANRRSERRRATDRAPDTAETRRSDDLPRSIRRAAGLDTFAETVPLAPPARAAAAARAFAAGNGYLPGLLVDRIA